MCRKRLLDAGDSQHFKAGGAKRATRKEATACSVLPASQQNVTDSDLSESRKGAFESINQPKCEKCRNFFCLIDDRLWDQPTSL